MISSDHTLLSQVVAGNEAAFRQLFDKHSDRIYGVAFAYTKSSVMAEEIVQDVFLSIWIKKESLCEVKDFPDYLYIMARNRIFNLLRRNSVEKTYLRHLSAYFNETAPSPEQQYCFKESGRIIAEAVLQLPQQQRIVYQLNQGHGLRPGEIAARLGLSRNTVRNHLTRAMHSIRSYLQQHASEQLLLVLFLLSQFYLLK